MSDDQCISINTSSTAEYLCQNLLLGLNCRLNCKLDCNAAGEVMVDGAGFAVASRRSKLATETDG